MNPDDLYNTCIHPTHQITELVTDLEEEENKKFID